MSKGKRSNSRRPANAFKEKSQELRFRKSARTAAAAPKMTYAEATKADYGDEELTAEDVAAEARLELEVESERSERGVEAENETELKVELENESETTDEAGLKLEAELDGGSDFDSLKDRAGAEVGLESGAEVEIELETEKEDRLELDIVEKVRRRIQERRKNLQNDFLAIKNELGAFYASRRDVQQELSDERLNVDGEDESQPDLQTALLEDNSEPSGDQVTLDANVAEVAEVAEVVEVANDDDDRSEDDVWKPVDGWYYQGFSDSFLHGYDSDSYLEDAKKTLSEVQEPEIFSAKAISAAYSIAFDSENENMTDRFKKPLDKKPLQTLDYSANDHPLVVCVKKVTFRECLMSLLMTLKSHEYAADNMFARLICGDAMPKRIIRMRDIRFRHSLFWTIVSLAFPLFGYISFAFTSRTMPIFAKSCIKGAALGTAIAAACFTIFAFAFASVLPSVFL